MGGGATGGGVVLQDGEHMKNTSSNMFVNAAAATGACVPWYKAYAKTRSMP